MTAQDQPNDNSGMDDKPDKRGGGTAAGMVTIAVLLVLPLLYVLSVGPVAWMATNEGMDASWIPMAEVIYRPLEMAAEFPIVGDVIQGYVGLWVPQPPVSLPPPAAVPAPTQATPSGS